MLLDKIGYTFHDPSLFETAMTHSSYANEQKEKQTPYNERLEFLGDSVLGFITASYLFSHYPDLPEGELTKLRAAVVCESALHEMALSLGIHKELRLGRGEDCGGGRRRPSILADATEALLGAIYLDGGLAPATDFVMQFLPQNAERARNGRMFQDYKTTLQEIVQKNKQEVLSYRLAKESGPDHNKHFVMEVLLNSNVLATGEGRSKKEAEQMAAKQALALMGQS